MDNTRPWSDLPEPIVGLFINKLDTFRDKVRALAVCKNWQLSKDYVKKPGFLPWVIRNHIVSFPNTPGQHSLTSDLADPQSRKTYKLKNAVNFTLCSNNVDLVTSKQGWLLFCGSVRSKSHLLYNPFTECTHWIDTKAGSYNMKAAMKTDPTRQCEVFMLYIWAGYLRIDTYNTSGRTLTSEIIVEMSEDNWFCSLVYMNGFVNCLFVSGELYSYSLETRAWTLLASKFPKLPKAICRFRRKCWLLEINGNLVMVIMAVVNGVNKWMIYRFDWSEMFWVVETGFKNCGIYLSGEVAFSAPLTNGSDEKAEECRLFYLNQLQQTNKCHFMNDYLYQQQEIKCYLMNVRIGIEMQCEEFRRIRSPPPCDYSFIEPPYFV